MDPAEVDLLRPLVDGAGIADDLAGFAATLGSAPHGAGGLLLVGTPTDEPWHFAAHLTDEARWSERVDLEPTLVRWAVPSGAPAHLAVGVERLAAVRRSETLLVISPDGAPEQLLDRVSGARDRGALVLTIDQGADELHGLAHRSLIVPQGAATRFFDVVQHLVTRSAPLAARQVTLRDRLNRLLDTAQGLRAPGSLPRQQRDGW
ncbi:MAG TPA: hypothetical protein VEZ46_00615 [Mycobacteriales bacterium]|nr:hypothetical protein [Mycobacteriales bacterium]